MPVHKVKVGTQRVTMENMNKLVNAVSKRERACRRGKLNAIRRKEPRTIFVYCYEVAQTYNVGVNARSWKYQLIVSFWMNASKSFTYGIRGVLVEPIRGGVNTLKEWNAHKA